MERNGDGAVVLEARLVTLKFREIDGRTTLTSPVVWAVAISKPGANFISGGAFYGAARSRILKGTPRALTLDEQAQVQAEMEREIALFRAQMRNEFHVDYIDAFTGKWLSAREGALSTKSPAASASPRK